MKSYFFLGVIQTLTDGKLGVGLVRTLDIYSNSRDYVSTRLLLVGSEIIFINRS